ncbi:hypothetical protein NTJ56_01010 [Burkholderia contaminans]|uniref:hypothetical protein n=1 Tax=Burkholderia contaminans TaxID=488447 RepID=UPI001CF20217|nr:hypothetical protein [Burkholderia contaminans]MCA7920488.1 hypothetical protein [Burkholderia contaminans]UUX37442.1 hypothetical protein NTJ56_01010 [Burkholderia contaminans]
MSTDSISFHMPGSARTGRLAGPRHAEMAWKWRQRRNAAPSACMPRHFNNLEDLTETTAPDNPALDYIQMKSNAIDNRQPVCRIGLTGRHYTGVQSALSFAMTCRCPSNRTMLRHPLAPLLSLACALTAGCAGTPALSPGAQAPDAPHPGAIALHHAWNGSTQTLCAQDFPASFIFRCVDTRGEPAEHARAASCVPVVEIESMSVDAAGRPVAPADAVRIDSTAYGPGHRFLDHTRLMRDGRPSG